MSINFLELTMATTPSDAGIANNMAMPASPPANQAVPTRSPLGDFEHQVMTAVKDCGEEAYGLRIAERLLEKNSNLAVAQVYVTLRRLEEKGFLSSEVDTPRPIRGGRARRVFKVEGKGEQALEQSTAFHRALVTSNAEVASAKRADGIQGKASLTAVPV